MELRLLAGFCIDGGRLISIEEGEDRLPKIVGFQVLSECSEDVPYISTVYSLEDGKVIKHTKDCVLKDDMNITLNIEDFIKLVKDNNFTIKFNYRNVSLDEIEHINDDGDDFNIDLYSEEFLQFIGYSNNNNLRLDPVLFTTFGGYFK